MTEPWTSIIQSIRTSLTDGRRDGVAIDMGGVSHDMLDQYCEHVMVDCQLNSVEWYVCVATMEGTEYSGAPYVLGRGVYEHDMAEDTWIWYADG